MSFAGSGIPASSRQATILTAAYHEISVQVVGCAISEDWFYRIYQAAVQKHPGAD